MEEDPVSPIVTQRFVVQIVGAEPIDLSPENALENIRKNGKGLAGYKVMLVAVLPEKDAGALIGRGVGHRIQVQTVDEI